MDTYIDFGVTEYRAQDTNLYSKVEAMFNENHLKFPSSTSIEIRGQNKKNVLYILALFSSIAEAKTFENQAAKARKKEVSKMKNSKNGSSRG